MFAFLSIQWITFNITGPRSFFGRTCGEWCSGIGQLFKQLSSDSKVLATMFMRISLNRKGFEFSSDNKDVTFKGSAAVNINDE